MVDEGLIPENLYHRYQVHNIWVRAQVAHFGMGYTKTFGTRSIPILAHFGMGYTKTFGTRSIPILDQYQYAAHVCVRWCVTCIAMHAGHHLCSYAICILLSCGALLDAYARSFYTQPQSVLVLSRV